MEREDRQAGFTPALLECFRVPWTGLGVSAVLHAILVPLLAIGFQEAVRLPGRSEAVVVWPRRYAVVTLRLPAELRKQVEGAKELRLAPALPKSTRVIPMYRSAGSAPGNVLILQPPPVRMEVLRMADIPLPTITMSAAAPPERRVFDVGSARSWRSMPKVPTAGALPAPPVVTAGIHSIQPAAVEGVIAKLPVFEFPGTLETFQAPEGEAVSTGGAVVAAPGNLVMASDRAAVAGEQVEVPAIIVLPETGTPSGTGGEEAGGGGGLSGILSRDGGGTATLPELSTTIRIVHPATGRHDVMIIHGGADESLAEARGFLDGEPVYTVYLNVGWKKDWILHYCLPREGPAAPKQVGGFVTLQQTEELRPPYPLTTMVPPEVPADAGLARPTGERLMFTGYLDTKGVFQEMQPKAELAAGLQQVILKALANWDMRPAYRGATPMRIRVVLVAPVS